MSGAPSGDQRRAKHSTSGWTEERGKPVPLSSGGLRAIERGIGFLSPAVTRKLAAKIRVYSLKESKFALEEPEH